MTDRASYPSPAGRVNIIKGQILKHAVTKEVLGITGTNKPMPRNEGDTIIFRRFLPYGAASTNQNTINRPAVDPGLHMVQEGVTPSADSISTQDVSVTLQQYACLYSWTDKLATLHEDEIPAEMRKQVGERMGLLREMIKYGVLRGCTNAFYSGGTSRATVAAKISITILSKISRNLQQNHAEMITEVLAASAKIDTHPIQGGYLVFCHTDLEHDLMQNVTDFVPSTKYGERRLVHRDELGASGRFRFILSPELKPYIDSGAAIGATGCISTGGALIDVYPCIVVAEDAWGDVALRGSRSFDTTYIPHGQKDKTDPLGQRGYAGAIFYSAAVITNGGWMAVLECGATNL